MTLAPFLRSVVGALKEAGIPAMLTGSVAAAAHGASRATMDVDLVIVPTREALDRFVDLMETAGYDVDRDAAHEALATGTMFNVIDAQSGWKADLILRKARAFSLVEFERREPMDLLGVAVDVARIEDLVVAKLEWAALGASARQVEDVRALLRFGGEGVDLEHVTHWVHALGLGEVWEQAREA